MAYDNFGRIIQNTEGLESSLKVHVTEVVNTKDQGTHEAMERLTSAVRELTQKLGDTGDQESSKGFADSVIGVYNKTYKNKQSEKTEKSDQKADAGISSDIKDIEQIIREINHSSQSSGAFWVSVGDITSSAAKTLANEMQKASSGAQHAVQKAQLQNTRDTNEDLLRNVAKAASSGAAAGGAAGGGAGGAGGAGGTGVGGDYFDDVPFGKIEGVLAGSANILTVLAAKLNEAFDLHPEDTIKGSFAESNQFRQNMRQLVHMQHGHGAINRDLEESYLFLDRATNQTGARLGVVEEFFENNLKRGLQDIDRIYDVQTRANKEAEEWLRIHEKRVEQTKSVTVSSLHTSKALEMNAQETNDLFMDWHMKLGLSAMEMQDMSRYMKDVARSTGVTSDRLLAAMKSAEQINVALKNAGSFSAHAGKNVTTLIAAAQKKGVGDELQPILQALTSRSAFFDADPILRSAMARAAKDSPELYSKMESGDLLDNPKDFPKLLRKMIADSKGIAMKSIGQFEPELSEIGIDLEDITAQNIPSVTRALRDHADKIGGVRGEEIRNRLGGMNQILEGAQGQMIGVWSKYDEMLNELEAKGYGETYQRRMGIIAQEQAKMLNADERLKSSDRYKQLQLKRGGLQLDEYEEMFSAVATQSQLEGGEFNKDAETRAINSLADEVGRGRARDMLGNLEQIAGNVVSDLKERIKYSGIDVSLEEILDEKGITAQGFEKMLANNPVAGNMMLGDVRQEVAKEIRISQDPITETAHWFDKANAAIKNFIQTLTSSDMADAIGGPLAFGGSMIGGIASLVGGGLGLAANSYLALLGAREFGIGEKLKKYSGWNAFRERRALTKQWKDVNKQRRAAGQPKMSRKEFKNIRKSREAKAATGQAADLNRSATGQVDDLGRGVSKSSKLGKYLKRGGVAGVGAYLGYQGYNWLTGSDEQPSPTKGKMPKYDDAVPVFVTNWGDQKSSPTQKENQAMIRNPIQHASMAPGLNLDTAFQGYVFHEQSKDAMQALRHIDETIGSGVVEKAKSTKTAIKNTKAVTKTASTIEDARKLIDDAVVRTMDRIRGGVENVKVPGARQAGGSARYVVEGAKAAAGSRTIAAGTEMTSGIAQKVMAPLRSIGTVVGKVLAPLDLAARGGYGYLLGNQHGLSTTEGVLRTLFSGSLETGTSDKYFSGMVGDSLGITKDTKPDEYLGAFASATDTGLLGASLGTYFGAPGAAVGAVGGATVGLGAENAKLLIDAHRDIERWDELNASLTERQKKMSDHHIDSISFTLNPEARLEKFEEQVERKRTLLEGLRKDQQRDVEARNTWGGRDWFFSNPYAEQLDRSIADHQQKIDNTRSTLGDLHSRSATAKKEIDVQEIMEDVRRLATKDTDTGETAKALLEKYHKSKSLVGSGKKEAITKLHQQLSGMQEQIDSGITSRDEKLEKWRKQSYEQGQLGQSADQLLKLNRNRRDLLHAASLTGSTPEYQKYMQAAQQIQLQMDRMQERHEVLEEPKNRRDSLFSNFSDITNNTSRMVSLLENLLTHFKTPNSFDPSIPSRDMMLGNSSPKPEFNVAVQQEGSFSDIRNNTFRMVSLLEKLIAHIKTPNNFGPSIELDVDVQQKGSFSDKFTSLFEMLTNIFKTPNDSTVPSRDMMLDKDTLVESVYGVNPHIFGPSGMLDRFEKQPENRKRIKEKGQASTNPLDYREETKGQANTSPLTQDEAETRVEQRKYGDASKATSGVSLSELNTITDYLVGTQSELLRQVISELKGIRENTNYSTTDIIGPKGGGIKTNARKNIPSIAKDRISGAWDLNHYDSSPGNITTEGRGGSR